MTFSALEERVLDATKGIGLQDRLQLEAAIRKEFSKVPKVVFDRIVHKVAAVERTAGHSHSPRGRHLFLWSQMLEVALLALENNADAETES